MSASTRHIAIVDDDPGVLRALGRLLRSANFEVEAFSSGTEFLLDKKSDIRFDCLVLDLHMPGATGFDVQVRLAQRGNKVPIVIITGHDTAEARSRSLALGAKRYLCKPIDDAALLTTIDSVIGSEDCSDTPRS